MSARSAWPYLAVVALIASISISAARADDAGKEVTGKAGRVELSGVGWVAYRYALEDSSARNVARDVNGFSVDRVYLTASYANGEHARWVTTLEGRNRLGKLELFVKKAYIAVQNPCGRSGTTFTAGQFDHAVTSVIDKIWGQRIVAQAAVDEYLKFSSTQVGVGMDGVLGNGLANWAVVLGNEQPYNRESKTKYKTGQARLILTPMPEAAVEKALHVLAYTQINNDRAPFGDNVNVAFGVTPYWQNDRFTLAAEFDQLGDKGVSGVAPNTKVRTTTSRILGGFGSLLVTPRTRLFGRFDRFDPDVDGDDDAMTRVIGGVARSYGPGLRALADVDARSYDAPSGVDLDNEITLSAWLEATF